MNLDGGDRWATCPYAIALGESDHTGAPRPRYTDALARWQAEKSVCALTRFGGDSRRLKTVLTVLPGIARFAVEGYVHVSGNVMVSFSLEQLAMALGIDKKRAARGVQLCTLMPTSEQSDGMKALCARLLRAEEEPFLGLVETGRKGRASVYMLMGSAGPDDDNSGDEVPNDVDNSIAFDPTSQECDPISQECDPVSREFDPISRSSSGLEPGSNVERFDPGLAGQVATLAGTMQIAPGSNAGKCDPTVEKSLGGHLLSSSYSLLSRGDAYTEFVGAFPGGVGNKAEETRAAFEARVREGYPPQNIVAGARRYRDMDYVPCSNHEKRRYPLSFLEDDDHFYAVVARGRQLNCR